MTDTTPEAARVFIDVYRRMSPGQKWAVLKEAYAGARALHAAGVRLRNPAATAREVHASWMAQLLDRPLPRPLPEPDMDAAVSNLEVLREVAGVFDRLGIAYALGGSMASSLHGIARFTQDADVTADPFPGKEADFAAAFGPDYYVSLAAVREAVRGRSSFNIIHTTRGFKVDVFIRKDEPFERAALERRVPVELPGQPAARLFLHSAEDVILFKLRWYRLGDETSQQQWSDVLGVLRVQAGKLDQPYLEKWAAELGVADLYARAAQEAAGV
jgi:hypothetical protein